jgi:hypothetical protein
MSCAEKKLADLTQYTSLLTVQMDAGPDIRDITEELDRIIRESGIREGTLAATVVGSTGSLTTIEYEPGVVADLKDSQIPIINSPIIYLKQSVSLMGIPHGIVAMWDS